MRSTKENLSVVLTVLVLSFASATGLAQDDAIAEAVPTTENIAQAETSVRPLTVAASLTDGSTISGTLLDSSSIAIKTAFGEASLPLSEVAGVRFPTANDSGTTVVMLNGDSITGATDLKFIGVETTWGSAKINGQSIANLLFVPGLQWQVAEGLGGKRWGLIEKTASQQTTLAPTESTVQPSSGVIQSTFRSDNLPTPAPRIIYGRQ